MAIDYVRFQRGSLEAYQSLIAKNRIDDNTLYFIYENKDDTTGSLYMGSKLIVSGENTPVFTTLDSLADVNTADAVENSFLVKDNQGQWSAHTPEQVAELIQTYLESTPSLQLDADGFSTEILNNVIQLKNFGTQYYAYVPAVQDESGNVIEPASYILTEGFKEGLIPQVYESENGFELAWYEQDISAIEELKTSVSNLQSVISGENGLISQVNTLQSVKADANLVYTKQETDNLISVAVSNADHLRRKIVDNLDAIDVNDKDALRYIYMVPTGLQQEDDKYDEYVVLEHVVIDEETKEEQTIRIKEKVGSWEVDLSDYARKSDLLNLTENNLSPTLLNKVNFITEVDSGNFNVSNGKLSLNNIAISQVTSLQSTLDTKVDKVEGSRLINNTEAALLTSLANGVYDNFITAVDTLTFEVVDGTLNLVSVPAASIEAVVGDLSELPHAENHYTLVDEINELHRALTWSDIAE